MECFGKDHPMIDLISPPLCQVGSQAIFCSHFKEDDLVKGLRDGTLLKGILRVKGRNWEDCYVSALSKGSKKRKFIDVNGSFVDA